MRKFSLFVAWAIFGSAVLMIGAAPASAHAARNAGPIHFEVGWGDEPTYAGFKNSVQFLPSDAKTGAPIVDLGDTMKVDVEFGGQTKTLSFQPDFEIGGDGTPGDYRAWIIPTRPGQYTFHVYGTVHGTKIDVSIASGETTFDDVKEPTDVQFPARDPSNAELADRIDRESTRNGLLARQAASSASSAKVIGWIGLGSGVIALMLVLAGIRRRAPRAS